jgi:hypothetical protein
MSNPLNILAPALRFIGLYGAAALASTGVLAYHGAIPWAFAADQDERIDA